MSEEDIPPNVSTQLNSWFKFVLANPGLDHYQLLGIAPFENDLSKIEDAASTRLQFLQSTTQNKIGEFHRQTMSNLASDIVKAKICLSNRDDKTKYDAQLASSSRPPASNQSSLDSNLDLPTGKKADSRDIPTPVASSHPIPAQPVQGKPQKAIPIAAPVAKSKSGNSQSPSQKIDRSGSRAKLARSKLRQQKKAVNAPKLFMLAFLGTLIVASAVAAIWITSLEPEPQTKVPNDSAQISSTEKDDSISE